MPTKTIKPQWKKSVSSPGAAASAPSGSPTPAGGGAPQTNAERATGLVSFTYSFVNLGASVTALQGTRDIGGVPNTIGVRMPYPGSIVGMSFESNAPKTAGTATFVPYVAGIAQSASLPWTVSNSGDVKTFGAGVYVFGTNQLVDVRVTTSSFAPTTADVLVSLFVSFS